jgi:hypothetical protein
MMELGDDYPTSDTKSVTETFSSRRTRLGEWSMPDDPPGQHLKPVFRCVDSLTSNDEHLNRIPTRGWVTPQLRATPCALEESRSLPGRSGANSYTKATEALLQTIIII